MLAATFLDVRYRLIINSVQCESAKTFLIDLVSNMELIIINWPLFAYELGFNTHMYISYM